jgi:hypothetical protein
VCKRVTGQDTTHVVFFNHGDLAVDHPDSLNRQPFNDQNPNGRWNFAPAQPVARRSCSMTRKVVLERLHQT